MGYALFSKYRSELMGVAMLWVMFFHAFDLDTGSPTLGFLRSIGFGGVDIFIVLSIMGLVMSLSRKEQDYSSFMARRARRILPAYFIVMIAYTLFGIARGTAPWSALFWNSSLLYYWVHAAGAFNWYIAGIMLFYALTPWCFRRMRDSRHREGLTLAGVLAGLVVCRLLIMDDYWNHLDVFYRFPLFFLGLLMGFYVLEDRKPGGKGWLFWGLSLVGGAAYLKLMPLAEARGLYLPLCHLFLFTTIPMCLVLCVLFEKLPLGWLRRFFRLLGENSLEIYLFNVSFFAETALLQSQFGFGPSRRLYYLISFTLNILLGVGLHKLVERLRPRKKA